jgi:membrane fusion protein, multidrug efflux system
MELDDWDRGGPPVGDVSAPAQERDAWHAQETDVRESRPPAPGRPRARGVTADAGDHDAVAVRARGATSRRGIVRRHPLGTLIAALLSGVAVFGGTLYENNAAHFETTDDAFIAARQFSISPRVAGAIVSVPVTDNQHVKAGGIIAVLDDRDYRAALEQAQAQVANAQANVENFDAQIGVQQAQIEANQAQVVQAQAALDFATQQATRYQDLARHGAGSVQDAQQYGSQLTQKRAALRSAQANLSLAQRQVDALKAQQTAAAATLAQARAQQEQAQLNLSYTVVRAAQAGHVVNLSAAVGQYVQAGTALASFVPDDIWVTANFKETQLDAMRPGEQVRLAIDAYPHLRLAGHVASIQPGSGTAFSLLPPENATGNYVKVVQRVPVKIMIDQPPADVALGPGMSVEPTVRVNPAPSLYERLKAWL